MARKLLWFSTGAASAVMVKIALKKFPDALIVNCDMRGSEDPDNERFAADCEKWWGREIVRIKSKKFDTIDDVFEKRKYLAGINGAPCTSEMKVAPRLDFQLPSDIHFWGYTADKSDAARFIRMKETYPNMVQHAPLIDAQLDKNQCFGILDRAGIKRPRVYDLGFSNGNCIGCVKASSPDYWALVRKYYPDVFDRRVDQSERFGAKQVRFNGERMPLSILPIDWPIKDASIPACDFLCQLASEDME